MRTARRLALLALALLVITPVVSVAKPTKPEFDFEGKDCELHVWALGRPNYTPKSSMLVRYTPPTAEELASPHSSVNIFNAAKRADALSEVQITALFPGAKSVKIVRHSDVIDMDVTPIKSIKSPRISSESGCYSDLVIANLYAIFPNPDAPYVQYGIVRGALASAIGGSDRLVVDFWMQQWAESGGKPYVYRRKNDSPLPHVQPASPQMLDAVRASADVNLAGFVAAANANRK